MTSIDKIILVVIIVQGAVVLAKPHQQENDNRIKIKREENCAAYVLIEDRDDCGPYPNRESCEKEGCCYDDTYPYGIRCFKNEICSVAPADRVDCGHGGITKSQCEDKGCCWDSSVSGVPWCFDKASPIEKICSIKPEHRVNCGKAGITKDECELADCCYDDSIKNAFWCFNRGLPLISGKCSDYVAPEDRIDCGYGGITKRDCENKGCCWDSSVTGAAWCFRKGDCGTTECLGGYCWVRNCRSSGCKSGEKRYPSNDHLCSGEDICCECGPFLSGCVHVI